MLESDKPTVLHGAKIRLYPNETQAAQFERWRRGCRSLWNLLLGMEQAAYSGEKFRPELKWRQKWIKVAEASYPKLLASFERKRGEEKKELEIAEEELASLQAIVKKRHSRLADATDEAIHDFFTSPSGMETGPGKIYLAAHRRYHAAFKAYTAGQMKVPPQPIDDKRAAMLGRGRAAAQPKLFLWKDELLKTMALLKREPLCGWIGDIHSHAGQRVCADLDRALKTMLAERRKRIAGQGGRDTGFPRFKKKSAYAEGSVYFANTQLRFDQSTPYIQFPLGVGAMRHGDMGHIPAGSKLMGGRVFREGEAWWLSAQFLMEAPKPLPPTGIDCGLKVAASIIATVVDSNHYFRQVRTPREPARHAFRMKLAHKSLSRRNRKHKAYYKKAAQIAYGHARTQNVRNDVLHKTSRAIANSYDVVSVQKMDVAALMTKDNEQKERRHLIKLNRAAAMAKFRQFVTYKVAEAGKLLNETPATEPIVQKCSACGKLNYMPLSKQRISCQCGNTLERRINAGLNELEFARIAKQAAE